MPANSKPHPTIVRYILDVRDLFPSHETLPLALLPEKTHPGIVKFFHHADRKLAFGSQILQRLLVCRIHFHEEHDAASDVEDTAVTDPATGQAKPGRRHIGLKDVEIHRDEESGRPYHTQSEEDTALLTPPKRKPRFLEDFNVSHAAGIVVLAARVSEIEPPMQNPFLEHPSSLVPVEFQRRKRKIGVDVVPTKHSPPTGPDMGKREATDEENDKWIKNFIGSQIFTKLEEDQILGETDSKRRVRKLYLLWALKEAYVKAIGTGLVTDLLAVEFRNTPLFDVDEKQRRFQGAELYIGGEKTNDWYLEVTAYGGDGPEYATHYLAIASQADGLREEDLHDDWESLDFEKDVLPYGPFPRMPNKITGQS
jgi:4'-phosphopantetheinyl transferase